MHYNVLTRFLLEHPRWMLAVCSFGGLVALVVGLNCLSGLRAYPEKPAVIAMDEVGRTIGWVTIVDTRFDCERAAKMSGADHFIIPLQTDGSREILVPSARCWKEPVVFTGVIEPSSARRIAHYREIGLELRPGAALYELSDAQGPDHDRTGLYACGIAIGVLVLLQQVGGYMRNASPLLAMRRNTTLASEARFFGGVLVSAALLVTLFCAALQISYSLLAHYACAIVFLVGLVFVLFPKHRGIAIFTRYLICDPSRSH